MGSGATMGDPKAVAAATAATAAAAARPGTGGGSRPGTGTSERVEVEGPMESSSDSSSSSGEESGSDDAHGETNGHQVRQGTNYNSPRTDNATVHSTNRPTDQPNNHVHESQSLNTWRADAWAESQEEELAKVRREMVASCKTGAEIAGGCVSLFGPNANSNSSV